VSFFTEESPMATRSFVVPKVTEVRVTRGAPHAPAIAAPDQRDLVAASLLTRP
jgi:hypothetical protein